MDIGFGTELTLWALLKPVERISCPGLPEMWTGAHMVRGIFLAYRDMIWGILRTCEDRVWAILPNSI